MTMSKEGGVPMTEALESGNRRAEMDGQFVVFFRVTGQVRRSKKAVWFVESQGPRKDRYLARRWVRDCRLPKARLGEVEFVADEPEPRLALGEDRWDAQSLLMPTLGVQECFFSLQ
jgi:hypothetical protein